MSVILHFKVVVYAVDEPRWTRSLLLLHFPPVGAHFRPSEPRHLQDKRAHPLTNVRQTKNIFKSAKVKSRSHECNNKQRTCRSTSRHHLRAGGVVVSPGGSASSFPLLVCISVTDCSVITQVKKGTRVGRWEESPLRRLQVRKPPLIITFCIFMLYRLTTRSS